MSTSVSVSSAKALTFDTVQADLCRLFACINEASQPQVFIKLSEVTVCDSAGLAMLLELKRLSGLHNKEIVFDGLPRCIQALAEFCGVDALLFQSE